MIGQLSNICLQVIMARKSVSVGDLTTMDRALIHTDLIKLKRKLKKAIRYNGDDDGKEYIRAGIKDISGDNIVTVIFIVMIVNVT